MVNIKKGRDKGITLIALVITIIILLILATITILALTGENGLFNRGKEASFETRFAGYKEEVDLYFNEEVINDVTSTELEDDLKNLNEYYSKGPNVFWDPANGTYNNIDPIMDASTSISDVSYGYQYNEIRYKENEYIVYYDWTGDEWSSRVSLKTKKDKSYTITDKTEMKNIIPDITDEDLEKVSIQNGELVYIPENVEDHEKVLLESVGIIAMTATIIFIANGQEFARINSDTIVFPANIPMADEWVVKNERRWNYDVKGYFVGWYSDKECRGAWTGTSRFDYYDYLENVYIDSSSHDSYQARTGEPVGSDELILYATFRSDTATCIVEGTLVTTSNFTQKNIEDITYEDELLVWNFDEGKFDTAKPIWIMKKRTAETYLKLKFDNGKELKLSRHRVFNVDKQSFTHADIDEETPIETAVFMEDGTTARVIGKEEITEEVNVYNVMTKNHINLFAEGVLTSLRFNELYEIKDMKFVKDDRELNKKEDYPNIPEKYFEGLRLAEQKNTLSKSGEIWWKERVEEVIMRSES